VVSLHSTQGSGRKLTVMGNHPQLQSVAHKVETPYHDNDQKRYRNTIAGSPPSERIFIYFEKIRFTSQKHKFSQFLFF
jgi:hypothetical protein